MVCEFGDGMKVRFAGSLQITKGSEVNVLIGEMFIPSDIKSSLEMAASRHSCNDMRKVADNVTALYGKRVCVH